MEAEVRAILGRAVDTPERVRMGTALMEIGQGKGLSNADVDALEAALDKRRGQGRHEPIDLK